ncbi:hypothetical protein XENOCAPTIV_015708 [Xenoophorus captivus]|uniref:Uncharacterized protein n=1 Tax=Xenoophorus captivus TaxID=1517983 RepID=A0ABV0RHU5_9TELE
MTQRIKSGNTNIFSYFLFLHNYPDVKITENKFYTFPVFSRLCRNRFMFSLVIVWFSGLCVSISVQPFLALDSQFQSSGSHSAVFTCQFLSTGPSHGGVSLYGKAHICFCDWSINA